MRPCWAHHKKLVTGHGVTVAHAGRDLGVHGTVLWRWIKDAAVDLQQAFPLAMDARAEPPPGQFCEKFDM